MRVGTGRMGRRRTRRTPSWSICAGSRPFGMRVGIGRMEDGGRAVLQVGPSVRGPGLSDWTSAPAAGSLAEPTTAEALVTVACWPGSLACRSGGCVRQCPAIPGFFSSSARPPLGSKGLACFVCWPACFRAACGLHKKWAVGWVSLVWLVVAGGWLVPRFWGVERGGV